jgi:hypothetical protein
MLSSSFRCYQILSNHYFDSVILSSETSSDLDVLNKPIKIMVDLAILALCNFPVRNKPERNKPKTRNNPEHIHKSRNPERPPHLAYSLCPS